MKIIIIIIIVIIIIIAIIIPHILASLLKHLSCSLSLGLNWSFLEIPPIPRFRFIINFFLKKWLWSLSFLLKWHFLEIPPILRLNGPVNYLVLTNGFLNILKRKKLRCLQWLAFRQLQKETIVQYIKWILQNCCKDFTILK